MFYKSRLKKKAEVLNREMPVVDYLLPYLSRETAILDVGSGPFSTVGTQADGKTVHLTACDIRADIYKRMMDEQGIIPLIPVQKQDMERLTYPSGSFDIVHCSNAADHTRDPHKAMQEMYRVCKNHGIVYLRHFQGSRNHRHCIEDFPRLPNSVTKKENGIINTVCRKISQ